MSDRPTVVTQKIEDLLQLNKDILGINGNDASVFYGDQTFIPTTPTICVESAPFDRELAGVGGKGRTNNMFKVNIIAYVGLVDDAQITRKLCEELGERVMDVLHQDVSLGGLVTHGFVTSIQPGYSSRSDGMMHAVRVVWQGQSKTMIV